MTVGPGDYQFWELLNGVVQSEPSSTGDPVTLGFFAAIGIEPVVATTMTNLRKAKLELVSAPKDAPETPADPVTAKPIAIRAGTKQAAIIALLERPEGASISEISNMTGWAPHSARGMIAGALKKRLGLQISTSSQDKRGRVYHICDSR